MIANGPNEALATTRRYDVCVIGSGPAGVTLALQLAEQGKSVIVLEAGGDTYDEKSQAMYDGDIVGTKLFDMSINRLRYFGGTSNHWGGYCRMLDAWDFEPKVKGIDTAWPIGRKDLDPFLDPAREILEIGCFEENEALDPQLIRAYWTYSPPVQFSTKYRDTFRRSDKMVLSLNSFVTNFMVSDGRIEAIEVRDPANQTYTLRANHYALCAGGIENSRLLLWGNERNEGRLIRHPEALGKYWMEHPHYTVGEALLTVPNPFELDRRRKAFFAPSRSAIIENGILNCGLRYEPTDYAGTKKLVADLACVAPELGRWAAKRIEKNLICGVNIRAAWEQAPLASNQIRLSSKRDSAGIPKPELHWRYADSDIRTVRETLRLFGEFLSRSNLGRVRSYPWVLGQAPIPTEEEHIGNHHMGGTRMSADPRHGVVDSHCRVHGLANLHVCGSSVFPSAGHANPTFTIVQLALRLARRLNDTLLAA